MKRLTTILGLTLLFISCGEATKKIENETAEKTTRNNEKTNTTLPSADYGSLLIDYTCNMDIAEVAKVLEVPKADLSIPEYAKKPAFTKSGNCAFSLKGFGSGAGGDTEISLGVTKMTKADIKNEINGYLKRKKDGLEKITKMYIVESDTRDSYIATQLRYGRVIILNENYDNAFLIAYGMENKIVHEDDHSIVVRHGAGTENANTDRTTAQHKELTEKMVKLANYLLKKHGK
ncbi:MAG: hypothetical protein KJN76_10745 [Eudoraea sp.]|nr:hypothetical protein [Eudoraea sp.]